MAMKLITWISSIFLYTILKKFVRAVGRYLMNNDLSVSVVVPTFNRLEFLKQAVESVVGQRYKNLELLIVDDASNDGTEDYCLQQTNWTEIQYRSVSHSGMPGKVRNAGAREARGEYLAVDKEYKERTQNPVSRPLQNHLTGKESNEERISWAEYNP